MNGASGDFFKKRASASPIAVRMGAERLLRTLETFLSTGQDYKRVILKKYPTCFDKFCGELASFFFGV